MKRSELLAKLPELPDEYIDDVEVAVNEILNNIESDVISIAGLLDISGLDNLDDIVTAHEEATKLARDLY